jgi:hypothetical protein
MLRKLKTYSVDLIIHSISTKKAKFLLGVLTTMVSWVSGIEITLQYQLTLKN